MPIIPPTPAPRNRGGALSYLSLFTSFGTLVCCALPSLLVLLGLGATVATVLTQVPWLVTMSHHKNWVFLAAGFLILGNLVYVYIVAPKIQLRKSSCDLGDATACVTASRFSRVVLWCSVVLYMTGCFTAYFLGPILVHFDL